MYLFLSYTEGMPTVVLEAMIFGLPIFTRKSGWSNRFLLKMERWDIYQVL